MGGSARRLCVCIVSSNSSLVTGGLESYTRFLLRDLTKHCDVSAVARFSSQFRPGLDYAAWEPPRVVHDGTVSIHIIAPLPIWCPLLGRLRHFTNRRQGRNLAITLFRQAYQKALGMAIPEQAEVVHYVGTGLELLGFVALAEARNRGAAFTILPAVHPGTWGDSQLDIQLYNQADAVFVLSQFEADHLIKLGVERSHLHLTGLAPASEQLGDGDRFRSQYGLQDRPLVLFIGRKNKSKGYHALCEAMTEVVDVIPDCCLISIGADGELPYPPVAQSALLDMGLASEQEKADALAACDVFCMPSQTDSFGIVYVEAWAYGKPVVVGPSPAVRELVTDGVNGLCVGQRHEEIAAALIRLLRDSILRQQLGAAGQARQQSCYTWDAVVAIHEKIFRDHINPRENAGHTT